MSDDEKARDPGDNLQSSGDAAPDWHPIHILMQEHTSLLRIAGELQSIVEEMRKAGNGGTDSKQRLDRVLAHLKESESHYLREENVLFPFLERHGVTQPPAVMWMEHDEIRRVKKEVYELVDSGDWGAHLSSAASSLAELLASHFYKENGALFPMAIKVITEEEWVEIRDQFDELGYCCFTPDRAPSPAAAKAEPSRAQGTSGAVQFETGSLSLAQLNAILDTLPVDVTFIDQDDRVRYFSRSADRIFERTKAIIGRTVQQCHPAKSLHVVDQLINDLKSGRRDAADFWITFKGRLVYIRYFAVRDTGGEYLGCMEVTQDVTDIKSLEGEKRLL
jgi:PAS domain S-box-containing protein